MALDRRITVRIGDGAGERNMFGEFIPGAFVDYVVWAEQRGAGSADAETAGGTVVQAARSYTVRWFSELAVANIAFVTVIDEDGFNWNAENISESDARRRLIYIETIRAVLE